MFQELKDWHRERLSIVLSRNPDFIAFETIPAQKEAMALVDLLKEYPNTKAWMSFACKVLTLYLHDLCLHSITNTLEREKGSRGKVEESSQKQNESNCFVLSYAVDPRFPPSEKVLQDKRMAILLILCNYFCVLSCYTSLTLRC